MANQVETFISAETHNRNRVSVAFRAILVVPILIFISAFDQWHTSDGRDDWNFGDVTWSCGLILLPVLLALVFRGIYPSYLFKFNQSILELCNRVAAYVLLLHDRYPTIEPDARVKVVFPEIDNGKALNQFLPLVKWFLAIPLYIVGCIYSALAIVMTIIGWFSIIFTGNFPTSCVNVNLGFLAFCNRVAGYAFLLVTDEYPAFDLK